VGLYFDEDCQNMHMGIKGHKVTLATEASCTPEQTIMAHVNMLESIAALA
jgi:hypothetical protein